MKKSQKKKQIVLKNNLKPGVIKYVNEDTNEIKKFSIILVCVAAIALLLYFVTAKYLVKDAFQNEEPETNDVEIDYSSIRPGTLFNRPYSEYYVFAYDKSDSQSSVYSALIQKYSGNTKIYTLDLGIESNKKYVGEKGNSKASNPEELSLTNPTLILIQKGKIAKYYEGEEKIREVLE